MKENKLIAEFMGLPFSKGEYYRPLYNSGDWIPENELQYHNDWNWLMPVVEKCYDNGAEENEIGNITHALLDCNKDHLYISVVEFINQLKQKR